MKKLYLFLMLLLPMAGFAQTITVSGAGTANYGSVSLDGTYNFAGTVNGKNSYSQSFSFNASGCYNCSASSKISWDGVSAWVLSTEGSGFCSYCNYYTPTARTNATATTLNPPCSGWPGSMTLGGGCEGGAISGYALSVSSVCQTGSITLSWTNDVALGSGNVFTATLSNKFGSFSSGTTPLGTVTSTNATSMVVAIPADLETGSGYKVSLSASEAPSTPYSVISTAITIGSYGSRPYVYDEVYAFCAGEAATLSTTSTYNSYQWYKVASNVYTIIPGATGQSYSIASISVSDAGNYVVQGKSAGGCLSEKSWELYVTVSPGPSISNFSNSYVNTCEENTTSYFRLNMNGAGSFTYDWKKGATVVKTETTTATTSSYTPAAGWQVADAGQYTVVISKVGCTNATTSQIANALVDGPITTPPSVTPAGAQVAPVTLTPSGSYGQYRLFKWNGTSYVFMTSTSEGSNFYVTQSGRYVVAAVNNCGVSGYSNEVTVTSICDTPPTITPATPTSLPATLTASTGFNSYTWYKWNGTSYQALSNGSSLNATTPGQYAVKGHSYDCGSSDFSTSVTIADPCANDQIAPSITSSPATVSTACGAAATWTLTATDNCTATGSITYKYYITGGSAIGDANNLQNGTGSGTAFTANAVVHLFAFDAANNKSAEQTFNVTANAVPDAPNATGVTVSTGEPAILSAANCSTFKWYDQETGGTLLHTGQNYTTNPLLGSTTFYVACSNGESCESARIAVLVTVSCIDNAATVIPTITNSGPVNSGQSVALSVSNLAPTGQAANFTSANNQYVEVQQSPPNNNFTIEMWIKTTEANGGIFSAGSLDINNPYADRHIYIENGMVKARIIPVGGAQFTSGMVVNDGQWHHVALTHRTSEGEGSRLYVDGRYTSSYPSTTECAYVPLFRIGMEQHSGGNNFFTGSIDQVRIWSVVRTPAEIRSTAQLANPENTTGLVFNTNLNGNANATTGTNGTQVNGAGFINVDHYTYEWTGQNAPLPGSATTQTTTGVAGTSYTLNVTPALCGTVIGGTSSVVVNCGQPATTQSGNWNNAGIWSCGQVPSFGQNATIEATHTVNFAGGMYDVAQLTNNGSVTGTGIIVGNIVNNGSIAPGNSPGTIFADGFTANSSSVLKMEISTQSAYDKLTILGPASINGTLNVTFIDGFVPTLGNAFNVLNYSSHTGTFATINLPVLPTALSWNTEYGTNAVKLSVVVNPLPVTLVSFRATVTDDQKVKLAWVTSEEVNASHFLVERSADAKRFEAVGKVLASGTTKESNSYLLTDETPISGTSYYRLRQVDLDGKEYVYRVTAVNLESVFKQTVFPNPAGQDMIRMTFKGSLPKIVLTDLAGHRIQVTCFQTDSDQLTIKPKAPLAPGLYILTAEHEGKRLNHKVVIAQ
jgi:hypothetical protein